MPQNIAPSKTVLANNNATTDDPIQQGISIARQENPNLAPVSMYGPVSKLMMPQAQGYTSPAGTIYLNPTQLQGYSAQDVADTITHEQTHAKQLEDSGKLLSFFRSLLPNSLPYGQRPEELAAFQAEKERRAMMGRTQTAYPSFSQPGQYVVPLDTNLPVDKKNAPK